ncbi:MAG: rhomboid family intramembrane serine protease [Bacteroidota bacterium]
MIFPIGDDQVKGGNTPIFSYTFIALNIAVFVYEVMLMGGDENAFNDFLMTYGAIPNKILAGQDLPTLFTSMFLHGGWMHIIGNMLFLWVFADNIEAVVGNTRFLIFYILGGLAAHAAHIWFNMESGIPTVGASGAISAVMGAYLVMFPKSKIKLFFFFLTFRVTAIIFLGFWIFQQVNAGVAGLSQLGEEAGVAWWAHIGGFVFGVLAGFYFRSRGLTEKGLAAL